MPIFSFEDAQNIPQSASTFSFDDAQSVQPRQAPMDLPRDAQGRAKLGADAFGDFLRDELRNADWGTRNIAGAGTALSDVWEGLKQFVGKGDKQQIDANKIIAEEAPVGAIAGNAAMAAIPFGLAGNTVSGAAKVGAVMGALQPVAGDQTTGNIVRGKLINTAEGGALAAGGQKLANVAGEYVANKAADLAMKKQLNAPEVRTLQDALDAGFVVPPSEVNPTPWNVVKESIAGKSATAQSASLRNSDLFNKAVKTDLGLADDAALTPEVLQGRRDLAYQVGYKPIAQTEAVNWDPKFIDDLKSLSPASKGGAVKSPAQDQIDSLLGSLADKNQWTGEQLIYDIRQLRQQANANFRAASMPGGNPGAQELAHVQSGAANALEELAGRNLGDSSVVDMLREARKYIAKSHGAEDALIEGSANVNPQALAAQLRRNPQMDGAMGTAARFANVYRDAAKPSNTIGAPAVSKLNFWISPLSAAALGSVFGPVGAVIGAATPFVAPPVMRARLLSRGSQNALRDIYKLGLGTRAAAGALQYAPVGGTVLGLHALSQ